ncbi:MAG: kynureninase [Gammaproteobacteria bacterium]|nr:kynureninase [Gammaproteobacteria bacterium]
MNPFANIKARFQLPSGMIYLDGNSLGPVIKGVEKTAARVIEAEWGQKLIGAWNGADWINLPSRVGDQIAPLIGAQPGSVMVGDSLSIKVYQAVAAALRQRPERRVILSDTGNFPTDLYITSGLLSRLGNDYELKLVAPAAIADSLDESVAAMLLTEVDYRTGRRHDMAELTSRAHAVGALALWDLAHSAGAFPVQVSESRVDFAFGCTYKYLNGGPGAPGFIYVSPDLIDEIDPALCGWMGHEAPFEFSTAYRSAGGTGRMRVGTPPVIAMSILETALEIWQGVNLELVREQSVLLSEAFIERVESECSDLLLVSPRNPDQRGSQVSFSHPQGYAVMQALIDQAVVGDFREPDIIRFGFTPLYLDLEEVIQAADILAAIVNENSWDQARFKNRGLVT